MERRGSGFVNLLHAAAQSRRRVARGPYVYCVSSKPLFGGVRRLSFLQLAAQSWLFDGALETAFSMRWCMAPGFIAS